MKRLAALILAGLALSACVSTYMKQFIGKDIREVIVADGPPFNELDMGDGRRAFQWLIGGSTSAVAVARPSTQNGGSAASGRVISEGGCLVTYFAKHDPAKNAWTIIDINYPQRLVC